MTQIKTTDNFLYTDATESRLPALDGLRGMSILLVIVSHCFFSSNLKQYYDLGSTGVHVFFVISGFLITNLLIKEKVLYGRINLYYFYARRACRLLPVLLLYLLVLWILNVIYHLQITGTDFLTALFFVKNFQHSNSPDWYTGHFWSLSIEEQFYFVFPFLLSRLSIKQYYYLLIGLLLFIPILNYLFFHRIGIFYSNKIIHQLTMVLVNICSTGTLLILCGSLMAIILFRFPSTLQILLGLPNYASIFLFFIAVIIHLPAITNTFTELLFGILIANIIVINFNSQSVFSSLLQSKLLTAIGVLSYSLYIWQQLFTHNQPWGNSIPLFINIIALFITATLSYYLLEKRFLQLKNRYAIK